MRLALAYVTRRHPDDITWIPPRRGAEPAAFWGAYECEAKRLGYTMTIHRLAGDAQRWTAVDRPSGLWIAVVPGPRGRAHSTHALVMHGDELHYDSGPRRRRHPNRILRIITLTPMCDEPRT